METQEDPKHLVTDGTHRRFSS